jgi:NADPH:quinone reductase-like Zn-dependent oxidoreductase
VRVRHRAVGLNFFDILQVQGKYQVKPEFPFTPGAEVAGEVDAVGPEVKRCPRGGRVFTICNRNGYAEYSVIAVEKLWPLPDGLDFAIAAAMPIVYHTSFFALRERARLVPGEWLLVVGFASGRIPSVAANRVLLKNLSVIGVFWGGYTQAHPEYIKKAQDDLERMWGEGMIRPVVSKTYPLSEAPRALRDLAERKILGKAALEVG